MASERYQTFADRVNERHFGCAFEEEADDRGGYVIGGPLGRSFWLSLLIALVALALLEEDIPL